MKAVPASAIREAAIIAKANNKPLFGQLLASIDEASDTVTFKRLPTLEEAEYVRRALDDMASKSFRAGSGGAGKAIGNLSSGLRGVIDDASPALKATRQAYADDSAIQNAAENGKTWLTKDGDFIEFAVEGMTQAEKDAAARGVRSRTQGPIGAGADEP